MSARELNNIPAGWPPNTGPDDPVLRDDLRYDEAKDTELGKIMARLAPK